jgi:HEPN domain-containing protein/predicted nucleotidyltransferase
MSHDKKERYKAWLEQAKYDVEAAKKSFEDSYYEWACYQSVQSVEKALKAVLVHAGWRPPMTHKLGVLVGLCNRANSVFPTIKLSFRTLEAYTFVSRYPFVYPGQKNNTPHELINKDDAETCLTIASELYTKLSSFLTDELDYPKEIIDPTKYYFIAQEIESRLRNVIQELVHASEIKVSKIILFGSFAREKTRPRTTTMDLLVIAESNMNFIERIKYVREITRGAEPIIEPLVYTQSEFDYMLNEEGEGFIESAIEEGRVIYPMGNDARKVGQ